MKCAVAIVLALFSVVVANPVPSLYGWGGLGSVVVPGDVSLTSSYINHGLSLPVVKPIISAPIYTAPIYRTPIIHAPILRTPIITSPGLGWKGLNWGGLGYGWGSWNRLGGWHKGWH